MVYMSVAMVALMGVASLAVDFGRVQMVRSELHAAASAAARYGSVGLADGTAVSKAMAAAAENLVDGAAAPIQAGDVELGTWNPTTRVFTAGGMNPNAVRVTLRKTSARGNAVPLAFARVVGRTHFDVTTSSIAIAGTGSGRAFDLFAFDSVNMSDSSTIRRRSGESGNVVVKSNGNWNLNNTSMINGDAHFRWNAPTASKVSGQRVQMTQDASMPSPTLPASYTNRGNVNLTGSSSLTLTAGNHYFTSLSLKDSSRLIVDNSAGPVRLFVNGSLSVTGTADLVTGDYSSPPEIYMVSGSGVDISSSQTFHAAVHAPNSPMNLNGAKLFGQFVVKSISASGSTVIEYSNQVPFTAAPSNAGGTVVGAGGSIATVR